MFLFPGSGLTLPFFKEHDPETIWVTPGDVHPNARGHTVIADAIYDRLTARRNEDF